MTIHEIYDDIKESIEERAYFAKNKDQDSRLIICECRAKILLVPDLDEMARSIEAHAMIHERKETDPEKAEAEHCRIEELLTQKVLALVSTQPQQFR